MIRAVSLERGIKHHIGIAVDEWGVSHKPAVLRNNAPLNIAVDEWGNPHLPESSKTDRLREKRVISLQDALVTGLYLNAFIRHASVSPDGEFHPNADNDRDKFPAFGAPLFCRQFSILLSYIAVPADN